MKTNTHYFKWITLLVILWTGLSYCWFQFGDYDEAHLRFLIQWSAKIAACCFCVAFGLSSFQYLFKDRYSLKLLNFRPEIGLSFAVSHIFHLGFLVILQYEFHPVFERAQTISLLAGGLAYLFLVLMLITTFPKIRALISVNSWKWLHTLGGYWIWFIFTRSYFKNVVNKNEEYFLFTILVLIMLLRLGRMIKKK